MLADSPLGKKGAQVELETVKATIEEQQGFLTGGVRIAGEPPEVQAGDLGNDFRVFWRVLHGRYWIERGPFIDRSQPRNSAIGPRQSLQLKEIESSRMVSLGVGDARGAKKYVRRLKRAVFRGLATICLMPIIHDICERACYFYQVARTGNWAF